MRLKITIHLKKKELCCTIKLLKFKDGHFSLKKIYLFFTKLQYLL